MKPVNIYRNLYDINALSHDAAVEVFFSVSGSRSWADGMAAHRPFSMLEHLFREAANVWQSLSEDEWKQALEFGETKLLMAPSDHLKHIEARLAGLLERMPNELETDENHDLA